MTGIYKISSPSSKVYIGQSVNIAKRWKRHRYVNTKGKLSNSLKKYGVENHLFTVCHELPQDVDMETLTTYEQLYMDLYREAGFSLLNQREAGSSGSLSLESRIKISKASKGRKMSEKTRQIISQINKGHKRNIGRKLSIETKQKMSDAMRGKSQSPQHRIKNSESKKGEKCYLYGIDSSKHPLAKKVKNIITGEVYGCVKEAAKALGIKRSTLSMRLTGKNKTKTGLVYDFE